MFLVCLKKKLIIISRLKEPKWEWTTPMTIKLLADEYIKSRISPMKQDNYANGLVKIQVCTSFHMRADTRRKVLPKLVELCVDTLSWCLFASRGVINKELWGEVTDEPITASNKRENKRRGWISTTVINNVALWRFYLRFFPAECPKIGLLIDLGLLALI